MQSSVKFSRIVKVLRDKAPSGLPHNNLSRFTQSFFKVCYWWLAKKGDIDAQYSLGELFWMDAPYQNRGGLSRNLPKAIKWFRRAGDQGHIFAQIRIGNLLLLWVDEDGSDSEAFGWFLKASKLGDPGSQWQIGQMYEDGVGVTRDIEKAAHWYLKAAEGDGNFWNKPFNREAMYEVAIATSIPQNALFVISESAFKIAKMYDRGEGLPRSDSNALKYYKLAAKYCSSVKIKAQKEIASKYNLGRGVPRDYCIAFDWYRKAAEGGETFSMYMLGRFFFYGKGTSTDYCESAKWIMKAQKEGNDKRAGDYELGFMYYYGKGVQQDISRAFSLLSIEAERGNPNAFLQLGWMYANGHGTRTNIVNAYILFRLALEYGVIEVAKSYIKNFQSKLNEAQITDAQCRIQRWFDIGELMLEDD